MMEILQPNEQSTPGPVFDAEGVLVRTTSPPPERSQAQREADARMQLQAAMRHRRVPIQHNGGRPIRTKGTG